MCFPLHSSKWQVSSTFCTWKCSVTAFLSCAKFLPLSYSLFTFPLIPILTLTPLFLVHMLMFRAEDRWGRSSSLKTPQHIIRRPSLGFDSLSASDLAEILTSIDYKLFRRVPVQAHQCYLTLLSTLTVSILTSFFFHSVCLSPLPVCLSLFVSISLFLSLSLSLIQTYLSFYHMYTHTSHISFSHAFFSHAYTHILLRCLHSSCTHLTLSLSFFLIQTYMSFHHMYTHTFHISFSHAFFLSRIHTSLSHTHISLTHTHVSLTHTSLSHTHISLTHTFSCVVFTLLAHT